MGHTTEQVSFKIAVHPAQQSEHQKAQAFWGFVQIDYKFFHLGY